MRGITALAVLALIGPVFAQGERTGPDQRGGPDGRRNNSRMGGGIEQKLDQILQRLERLEQRVEERDRDQEHRRHDRDERSPRRGPARRDGSRRGPRHDVRPNRPGPDAHHQPGPDAAPIAHFRRLMQAAQKGDPKARKMLGHMYKVIGQALGKFKKEAHKKPAKKPAHFRGKAMKTAKAGMGAPGSFLIVTKDAKVADKRRAAAVKLMKVEKKEKLYVGTQFRVEQHKLEAMKRAAHIAELRAHALRLQREIEALKLKLQK